MIIPRGIGFPPFGYLRIIAYLLLPEAFRGSSRPSSASSAKAFTMRPFILDLFQVEFLSLLGRSTICSLWLSRFFAWIIFSFQCTSSLILSDQWRLTGSNRWPPACKAGALPTELSPQGLFFFQPDITLALFCRYVNGPKWTWTIDLTLIRRAL